MTILHFLSSFFNGKTLTHSRAFEPRGRPRRAEEQTTSLAPERGQAKAKRRPP